MPNKPSCMCGDCKVCKNRARVKKYYELNRKEDAKPGRPKNPVDTTMLAGLLRQIERCTSNKYPFNLTNMARLCNIPVEGLAWLCMRVRPCEINKAYNSYILNIIEDVKLEERYAQHQEITEELRAEGKIE